MVVFVAVFHWGAIGLVVGNFTGTLARLPRAASPTAPSSSGCEFDRALFRRMQHVRDAARPVGARAVGDQLHRPRIRRSGTRASTRSASTRPRSRSRRVITFVMIAFRTAWPAFAYSIEDDREAKRTYAFVLDLSARVRLVGRARARRARAVVDAAAHRGPQYHRAEKGVALLAFAGAIYAGYTVLAIGSGRARRTQLNWVVTGVGAAANIALNFWLIPKYGMVGASISTLAAYVVLFVGMTLYAQHVYPVAYQWRRVVTAVGAAVGADRRRPRSRPLARAVARARRGVSARARCCSASTCRPSARARRLVPPALARTTRGGARSARRRRPRRRRASASARPPSTRIGSGTPLPSSTSAATGPLLVAPGSSARAGELAVSSRSAGQLAGRRAQSIAARPWPTCFGTGLPCAARRSDAQHRRRDVRREARVDRARPAGMCLQRIAVARVG